ncbi:MAG TPA: patatin-like phospholipase family protein [Stellaceae bacterium]|nr:patatin-like phospholipase family protein [Stellaceae bacterium]
MALLLQGGGALGAYQGGVYEALAEADLHPDWVAGISVGAINSAIIAGNPAEQRVAKLRAFWEGITAGSGWAWSADAASRFATGDAARKFLNQASAAASLYGGAPGFFTPRLPSPWLWPDGSIEATSWYETGKLRTTLERLVDFDRINGGEMRASLGAVNVRSGNFVYFDTETDVIRPEHVLASGALPPGFPAIEIEGQHYWDGGLVSNTPLQWVLQDGPRQDTLAFQVDLWSARGDLPRNLAEVATRHKEISYSSRTRNQTDRFKHTQTIRHAVATLMQAVPEQLKNRPEAKLLQEFGDHKVYNIVHLIYRAQNYEGYSKDYEFSRRSMEEHWRAGYHDTADALRHSEALARPANLDGVSIFDFAEHGGR